MIKIKNENLDKKTRELMDEEYNIDKNSDRLYFSPRLSENAQHLYSELLGKALNNGNINSFIRDIIDKKVLRETERRINPLGGILIADVPKVANETLADGEFNRYYIRAICRKAIQEEIHTGKP